MKQFDHIRTEHLDLNEAVGNALAILNNKRRKNNTVYFEDIQIVNSGLYFVVVIYSYEDQQAETPPPARSRWIGQVVDQPQTDAPIARKRFISEDHSDS